MHPLKVLNSIIIIILLKELIPVCMKEVRVEWHEVK